MEVNKRLEVEISVGASSTMVTIELMLGESEKFLWISKERTINNK